MQCKCHLLEEGGCDGDEELRAVGGLQDGPPGVDHQAGPLHRSLDVIELLLHVIDPPDIPQHLLSNALIQSGLLSGSFQVAGTRRGLASLDVTELHLLKDVTARSVHLTNQSLSS